MKIKITVKSIDTGESWDETYDEFTTDPQAWASNLIDEFNRTLRKHESARELLSVEILSEEQRYIKHNWLKKNLVTISKGSRNYDEMVCSQCGITGKRLGLSSSVTHDSKFKAKIYTNCSDSTDQLKKNAAKRKAKGK